MFFKRLMEHLNGRLKPEPYEAHLKAEYPALDIRLLRQADTAFRAQNWKKAEKLWQSLIASYPAKAHARLTQIYRAQVRPDLAESHFKQALPLLEQRLANIPNMDGQIVGQQLRTFANNLQPGHAVLEIGSWLGGGTAHIALGLLESGQPHLFRVYDRWKATESEIRKATLSQVHLEFHQDTLPLVKSYLDPFAVDIHFHQGDLREIKWEDGEIGLYVDDAAKQPKLFLPVIQEIFPYWVPGKTILVLQDFNYWQRLSDRSDLMVQKDFIDLNPGSFTLVEENIGDTVCCIYKYQQVIDPATINHLQEKYSVL